MIIKVLAFIFVFAWLVRWLLRPFLSGLSGQQVHQRSYQQRQQTNYRPPSGNVRVEVPSDKDGRKNKTSDDFKGGDYIDFEEVD